MNMPIREHPPRTPHSALLLGVFLVCLNLAVPARATDQTGIRPPTSEPPRQAESIQPERAPPPASSSDPLRFIGTSNMAPATIPTPDAPPRVAPESSDCL